MLAHPQTPARAAFPGANGKIAFHSDRDGNFEVYVMNADGSEQTNLTNNSAADGTPAWSPDGTKIAFASDRDEPDPSSCHDSERHCNFEIYVMNADGAGVTRLTYYANSNEAEDALPAWSPDGSQIAFVRSDQVYVMNADGSGQTNLTNNGEHNVHPAWSPDGSKIAFERGYEAPNISVMNADGSGQTLLFREGSSPAWSPDGSQIVFAWGSPYASGSPFEICVMNADGSAQTNLTNNAASDRFPDWQPLLPAGPTATPIPAPTPTGSPPCGSPDEELLVGDADCSGVVNSIDALLVLQYGAGLLHSLACQGQADVNHDGDISSLDALLILQYDAGIIQSLPA